LWHIRFVDKKIPRLPVKSLRWIGPSKSKKGIETPQRTIELIKRRLKVAIQMHAKRTT
jgi:hypothetical protein